MFDHSLLNKIFTAISRRVIGVPTIPRRLVRDVLIPGLEHFGRAAAAGVWDEVRQLATDASLIDTVDSEGHHSIPAPVRQQIAQGVAKLCLAIKTHEDINAQNCILGVLRAHPAVYPRYIDALTSHLSVGTPPRSVEKLSFLLRLFSEAPLPRGGKDPEALLPLVSPALPFAKWGGSGFVGFLAQSLHLLLLRRMQKFVSLDFPPLPLARAKGEARLRLGRPVAGESHHMHAERRLWAAVFPEDPLPNHPIPPSPFDSVMEFNDFVGDNADCLGERVEELLGFYHGAPRMSLRRLVMETVIGAVVPAADQGARYELYTLVSQSSPYNAGIIAEACKGYLAQRAEETAWRKENLPSWERLSALFVAFLRAYIASARATSSPPPSSGADSSSPSAPPAGRQPKHIVDHSLLFGRVARRVLDRAGGRAEEWDRMLETFGIKVAGLAPFEKSASQTAKDLLSALPKDFRFTEEFERWACGHSASLSIYDIEKVHAMCGAETESARMFFGELVTRTCGAGQVPRDYKPSSPRFCGVLCFTDPLVLMETRVFPVFGSKDDCVYRFISFCKEALQPSRASARRRCSIDGVEPAAVAKMADFAEYILYYARLDHDVLLPLYEQGPLLFSLLAAEQPTDDTERLRDALVEMHALKSSKTISWYLIQQFLRQMEAGDAIENAEALTHDPVFVSYMMDRLCRVISSAIPFDSKCDIVAMLIDKAKASEWKATPARFDSVAGALSSAPDDRTTALVLATLKMLLWDQESTCNFSLSSAPYRLVPLCFSKCRRIASVAAELVAEACGLSTFLTFQCCKRLRPYLLALRGTATQGEGENGVTAGKAVKRPSDSQLPGSKKAKLGSDTADTKEISDSDGNDRNDAVSEHQMDEELNDVLNERVSTTSTKMLSSKKNEENINEIIDEEKEEEEKDDDEEEDEEEDKDENEDEIEEEEEEEEDDETYSDDTTDEKTSQSDDSAESCKSLEADCIEPDLSEFSREHVDTDVIQRLLVALVCSLPLASLPDSVEDDLRAIEASVLPAGCAAWEGVPEIAAFFFDEIQTRVHKALPLSFPAEFIRRVPQLLSREQVGDVVALVVESDRRWDPSLIGFVRAMCAARRGEHAQNELPLGAKVAHKCLREWTGDRAAGPDLFPLLCCVAEDFPRHPRFALTVEAFIRRVLDGGSPPTPLELEVVCFFFDVIFKEELAPRDPADAEHEDRRRRQKSAKHLAKVPAIFAQVLDNGHARTCLQGRCVCGADKTTDYDKGLTSCPSCHELRLCLATLLHKCVAVTSECFCYFESAAEPLAAAFTKVLLPMYHGSNGCADRALRRVIECAEREGVFAFGDFMIFGSLALKLAQQNKWDSLPLISPFDGMLTSFELSREHFERSARKLGVLKIGSPDTARQPEREWESTLAVYGRSGEGFAAALKAALEHDYKSEQLLDPNFVLPLLLVGLQHKSISVKVFSDLGCLQYALLAISSASSKFRSLGFRVLSAVDYLLRSENFVEKPQLQTLLAVLRNAFESDSFSYSSPPQPPTLTMSLLAHGSKAVVFPLNPAYAEVNKYLLSDYVLDLKSMRLFGQIFTSTLPSFQRDLTWALTVLRASITTRHEHRLLAPLRVLENLLMIYTSEDTQSNHKVLILQIFAKIFKKWPVIDEDLTYLSTLTQIAYKEVTAFELIQRNAAAQAAHTAQTTQTTQTTQAAHITQTTQTTAASTTRTQTSQRLFWIARILHRLFAHHTLSQPFVSQLSQMKGVLVGFLEKEKDHDVACALLETAAVSGAFVTLRDLAVLCTCVSAPDDVLLLAEALASLPTTQDSLAPAKEIATLLLPRVVQLLLETQQKEQQQQQQQILIQQQQHLATRLHKAALRMCGWYLATLQQTVARHGNTLPPAELRHVAAILGALAPLAFVRRLPQAKLAYFEALANAANTPRSSEQALAALRVIPSLLGAADARNYASVAALESLLLLAEGRTTGVPAGAQPAQDLDGACDATLGRRVKEVLHQLCF